MEAPKAGTIHYRILRAVAGSIEGLTDVDLQEILGIHTNIERPRRGELVGLGWLTLLPGVGEPAEGGRTARVWVLTEAGRAAWIENDGIVMCPKP